MHRQYVEEAVEWCVLQQLEYWSIMMMWVIDTDHGIALVVQEEAMN